MAIKTTITANGKKRRCGIRTVGAIQIGHTSKPVAGLNEAAKTPQDLIYNRNTRKAMARNARIARREARQAYFDATHEYQLWYGETPFGKPRSMTGREAYDKNQALEMKFYKDKNPDAHLWRWHKVGTPRIRKGMTSDQHRKEVFEYNAKKKEDVKE
jgi:hypothetical protein